jgi:cytoskeletal protein RodZ
MPTSIFTDDTGRRSERARWAVRVISVTLVIGVGAIVLSLFTHVSLPNLGLPDPTSGNAEVQKSKQSGTSSPSATATTPSPTAATSAARRAAASGTSPAQSTATTPAPAATTSSSSNATDAPRAAPSHAPGTPPTAPPGKSK